MIRLVFAAIATLATVAGAQGQAYPDKTIRIISGTQTGTSGDLAGRLLAQKLTTQMGQPVVFESRPGANGRTPCRADRADTMRVKNAVRHVLVEVGKRELHRPGQSPRVCLRRTRLGDVAGCGGVPTLQSLAISPRWV